MIWGNPLYTAHHSSYGVHDHFPLGILLIWLFLTFHTTCMTINTLGMSIGVCLASTLSKCLNETYNHIFRWINKTNMENGRTDMYMYSNKRDLILIVLDFWKKTLKDWHSWYLLVSTILVYNDRRWSVTQSACYMDGTLTTRQTR